MGFIKNKIGKRLLIQNVNYLNRLQKEQNQKTMSDRFYKETYGYAAMNFAIKRCALLNNIYVVVFGFDDKYTVRDY
jgi:hypothetical protein